MRRYSYRSMIALMQKQNLNSQLKQKSSWRNYPSIVARIFQKSKFMGITM